MYKRIIITALASAVMLTASSALAAENDQTVNIQNQSCMIDVSLINEDYIYQSSSIFTADTDMKMVIVADNAAVQIVNRATGEVTFEKKAENSSSMLNVKAGETYSIKVIAAQDNHASVYVYGI